MESYHMYEETGLVSASALAIYITFNPADGKEQSPIRVFLCLTPHLIVCRELHHPLLLGLNQLLTHSMCM
jgi:hypothetical protein